MTLADIVFSWITMAIGTTMIMLLTSMIDVLNRGPLHRDSEAPSGSSYQILWVFLIWPILLYLEIRAAMEGMSVPRYLQRQKAAKEELKQKREMLRKQGLPFRLGWSNAQTVLDKKDMLVHIASFETKLSPEASISEVVLAVHLIIEKETGDFRIFRATPGIADSLLMWKSSSLQEAKTFCENDFDWIKLCAPGKESARLVLWGLQRQSRMTMMEFIQKEPK